MHIKDNWELEDILTIQYVNNFDLKTIRNLIEKFESFEEITTIKANFKSELFEDVLVKARNEAKRQIDLCEKNSIRILTYWDKDYPKLLKEIPSAPIVLYVKGKLQAPDSLSISIVGTRKCTHYGAMVTEEFSEFLAKNCVIITSGLAEGIDSIAHKSALKANGITYAVLGSSLDNIYPMSSEKLYYQIIENGGAIISEYKLGTVTRPPYFIHRNRIISGLSKATIVVESRKKGGALITAEFAFDQNRELYAVPGKINSPTSEGTNHLIHINKAKLVQKPEQVLSDLNFDFKTISTFQNKPSITFTDPKEKLIYDVLTDEPMHIDTISNKTELEITDVLVKLLNLEFGGLIKQLPGKYYIKI